MGASGPRSSHPKSLAVQADLLSLPRAQALGRRPRPGLGRRPALGSRPPRRRPLARPPPPHLARRPLASGPRRPGLALRRPWGLAASAAAAASGSRPSSSRAGLGPLASPAAPGGSRRALPRLCSSRAAASAAWRSRRRRRPRPSPPARCGSPGSSGGGCCLFVSRLKARLCCKSHARDAEASELEVMVAWTKEEGEARDNREQAGEGRAN